MPPRARKKKKNKTSFKISSNHEKEHSKRLTSFEQKVESGKRRMRRENFPDEIWEKLMNKK